MFSFIDVFSAGGPRGARGAGKPRQRRGENVIFPLRVDLEDLYSGSKKKLRLTKNVVCKACQG